MEIVGRTRSGFWCWRVLARARAGKTIVEYIVQTLLIHLDDTDEIIRQPVFEAMKVAAKISPGERGSRNQILPELNSESRTTENYLYTMRFRARLLICAVLVTYHRAHFAENDGSCQAPTICRAAVVEGNSRIDLYRALIL